MGHVPVPMQPISDDATPEERERIKREYREYLMQGYQHLLVELRTAIIFFIVGAVVILGCLLVLR